VLRGGAALLVVATVLVLHAAPAVFVILGVLRGGAALLVVATVLVLHAAPAVCGIIGVRGLDGLDGRPTAHALNQHAVDAELLCQHLQDAPFMHVLETPQVHCVRCSALGWGDTHDGVVQ
jgi:hypothetical protein